MPIDPVITGLGGALIGAVSSQGLSYIAATRRARLEAAFSGLAGLHEKLRVALARTVNAAAAADDRTEYLNGARDANVDAIAAAASIESALPKDAQVHVLALCLTHKIDVAIKEIEAGHDVQPALDRAWVLHGRFLESLRTSRGAYRVGLSKVPTTKNAVKADGEIGLMLAEGYDVTKEQ